MDPYARITLRIHHMHEAMQNIRDLRRDHPDSEITAHWFYMLAVERCFEILSEASRHIPADFKASEPDIPWKDIAGIGNVLRHDYDGVEFSYLLATSLGDFDALDAALTRILARLPPL